jgi:hypothetical protein
MKYDLVVSLFVFCAAHAAPRATRSATSRVPSQAARPARAAGLSRRLRAAWRRGENGTGVEIRGGGAWQGVEELTQGGGRRRR